MKQEGFIVQVIYPRAGVRFFSEGPMARHHLTRDINDAEILEKIDHAREEANYFRQPGALVKGSTVSIFRAVRETNLGEKIE